MKVYVLCVMLAVLGSVRCQVPGPCCFPPQMESQVEVYVGQSGDDDSGPTLAIERTDLFYDYTHQRTAARTNTTSSGETTHTLILLLYTEKKMYTINYDTDKCTVAPLEGPMLEGCVPSTAKKEEDFYLGVASNRSLPVTPFSFSTSTMSGTVTVTSQCVPVTEVLYGGTVLASSTVRNVVLTITRPDVFNVPSICQQATKSVTKHASKRKGLIGI